MTVRRARESDFERLREFDGFEKATKERIQSGECLVAELDGVVSAYAVVSRGFFERPFVAYLYVAAEKRRAGLCASSALLAHIESECAGPKLWISTALTNAPMQNALEKRKYRFTGVVHGLHPVPELIYYKEVGS